MYEATGQLCAVTTKKTPLPISKSTSYEEYLAMKPAPNVETVVPLNLSTAMGGQAASAMNGEPPDRGSSRAAPVPASNAASNRRTSITSRFRRKKTGNGSQGMIEEQGTVDAANGGTTQVANTVRMQMSGTGRQVKARMWLANDSPINQKQLLPLLDVVGSTNQYISKVRGRL